MKASSSLVVFLIATLLASGAQAALSVDSVNYPAWVERGKRLIPVEPGQPLRAGDLVRTGSTGRLWLQVDDGSVIKLGRGARFTVQRAEFRGAGDASVLSAAFDVLKGAFRFTSNFFAARRQARHEVDFQVGAVTAGIRGTDIWGRSGDDEDFVALLEGSIQVSSAGETPQLMDQALTLYAKKRGQASQGVQAVELATVQSLAPETELDVEAGIANTTGAYGLVLMSLQSAALVDANLQRFRQAGYPAVAVSAEVAGTEVMRILLTGLADRRAAENLRTNMARQFAVDEAWIINNP